MRELVSKVGGWSGGSGEHARRLHGVLALGMMLAMWGCVSCANRSNATGAGTAPIQTTDACASRLHDISGLLLMYSLNHPDLPGNLDELRSEPGFGDVKEFVCPVSHKPYVYNPDGIPYEGGFLVLYDATPAHSGMRWAIQLTRPTGNQPIQMKVIAVKNAVFKSK